MFNSVYRCAAFGNSAAKDGTALDVSQDEDMWTVSAEDGGHFRFAHALITGG